MDVVKTYIRNNKLNVVTYVIAFIAVVAYVVGITKEISNETELNNILSMSADYVTICSCIIVLIQLVAFFSDSRHKESRCRKEAALKLGEEYATKILHNITYIENVLATYYDKDNPALLYERLSELSIDRFVNKDNLKNKELERYFSIFKNRQYDIPYDLIVEKSVSYHLSYNLIELKKNKKTPEEINKTVNIKFKHIIFDTLNNLECFSMSVNHNVAESEMLYPSLHHTYLKFVRFMYPLICMQNNDEENYYTNVIELYRTWEGVTQAIEECREEGRILVENKIKDKKRKFRKPL